MAVGVCGPLRPGQLLCPPGNRSTQPVFTEFVWRSLIVLTGTVAVAHHILRRAVALAGYLRRAIRQQLHIAVEDEGNRLVHTAVALGQLGLRLLGDRCHSLTPGSP